MKRFILILFFFSTLWGTSELTFSSHKIKNGETLLLNFKKNSHKKPIHIIVGKEKYPFYALKDGHYYALIPIAYNSTLGQQPRTLLYEESGQLKRENLKPLKVVWGGYKKERLSVNSSKIELSAKDAKRAEKEYAEAMHLYAKKSKDLMLTHNICKPLKTFITSDFGNERVFIGIRKSYHSGVDFRAKVGTPIFAMGCGKVVLVQDRFYAGLSVVVDHGQGIFSGYYHLSRADVKVGDIVGEKSRLGLSGKSGRITGPHLHFSLKVHGITVNPLQFQALIRKVLP